MTAKSLSWATLATGIFVTGLLNQTSHAQSVDALLNKLVDKGVLTSKEADDLKKDTDKDFTKAYKAKSGMPDWVNSVKFGGDFRGRYDGIFQDEHNAGPGNATEDRHRLRYRLRFGSTIQMNDHFEVGLRLGSGEVSSSAPSLGGNIFSANTTLNNDASRKFIFVDLAYAKWKPSDWAQVEFGKMNSAFWFTDMTMDPDYNPEGAQQKLTLPVGDMHKFSFTSGQFVIAENFTSTASTNNNNDTYLFVNQVDWSAQWAKNFSTRVSGAMMNFLHQRDVPSSLEDFIGSTQNGARLDSGPTFNPIIARGEASFFVDSFPCFQGPFPITPGVEYAWNPPAKHGDNEAWNFGLTLGSNKKKGNWQIAYNYKIIEPAAVWRGLNDDDFGFNAHGGTDVRGHQVIASYHVADPLLINLRYMKTEKISNAPGTQAAQDRLFFDMLWAF